MNENFQKCLKIVLHHEGIDPDKGKTGWVQHPKDNDGGATNYGITRYTYQDFKGRDVSIDEMKNMPYEDVEEIYKTRYWDRVRGDDISEKSVGLALSVFDWAVNSGTGRSAKGLQKACGANPDGAIGPKTLKLALAQNMQMMIKEMYEIREKFYRGLSKYETFGRGWSRRNEEVYEEALKLN